jgi:hypothetical protein
MWYVHSDLQGAACEQFLEGGWFVILLEDIVVDSVTRRRNKISLSKLAQKADNII